jgi:Ni/Fe-hydrogenase subunit HybB-like protein
MNDTTRTRIKDGLWVIVFAGLLASVIRFTGGLGMTTGMNDSAPWGLWIAFKLVFVAIAGGGFTLAAMVYIFRLEQFRPVLRRAILIAFLGYGSFIVSLIFDLGLPWHIYKPIFNWQHHSVMFEIAWCVMLYFTVLILEFSPVILEHPLFNRPIFKTIADWLHRLTIPIVITGIVLSTLHQSSLGSLFLIMPHRVHPLWYSPWIPYMFFTSAIATGLVALIVEAFLVEGWFEREIDFKLLERLAKVAVWPLGLYLLLRLSDLFIRGVLPSAIDGSWQSIWFLAEILLGGILPVILFSIRKIRQTREGMLTGALLAVFGIMSQRMSLSMFTMFRPEGTSYVPALGEIIIAFFIPSAAVLIYLFFAENLQVLDSQPKTTETGEALPNRPLPSPLPIRKSGFRAIFGHRSGIAVFTIALFLPLFAFQNNPASTPVSAAKGWETLSIDGNQSGYVVEFPHLEHQERLIDEETRKSDCQTCHHLDAPNDEATACSECHSDYYQPASIFDHTLHQSALGGNQSCQECHTEEHVQLTGAICQDCHINMTSGKRQETFSMMAVSYQEAMHGRCLTCHEVQAAAQNKPELALCSTCHEYYPDLSEQTTASLSGE